ncbi:hypothetical protein ACQRUO_21650, partial [Kitasatospora sp. LaBMicrA B282]
ALVLADRAAGSVPLGRLRERARTAAGVLAALRTVELRAARLAVTAGSAGGERRIRLRLPMPRQAWLVVPWRDATALLRAPSRLGRAVLLAVPALLCGGLAHGIGSRPSVPVTAVALVFGYLALAQLLEPARIETDDTRRAAWSPYPLASLMLRHAVVPTALGLLVALLGAGAAALAGGGAAVWLAPAAVPALVAAGLVNACRGAMRRDLMYRSPTPGGGGGLGLALFVGWYAAGPAAAVVALTLPFAAALRSQSAAGCEQAAVLGVVAAAVLLAWARSRAGELTGLHRVGGGAD